MEKTTNNRHYGLDFARLLAALLVVFGHFVFSGTFGVDDFIHSLVGLNQKLPLLEPSHHYLWRADMFLLDSIHSASAILGVALFFMISGWIVPQMLIHYSSLQFLINRFFRIYPMLFFAVILGTFIQFQFGDRLSIHLNEVFSTLALSNWITGTPLTLGVVWTLIIECKFYLFLSLIGELNLRKIYFTCGTILSLLLIYIVFIHFNRYSSNANLLLFLNSMAHDFCFLLFMLAGSTFWLTQQKESSGRFSFLRKHYPFVAVLMFYNLYRILLVKFLDIQLNQDINIPTQIIAITLFYFFSTHRFFSKNNFFMYSVSRLSNVTYSMYLIHVSLGFLLLSRLRYMIDNEYILLASVVLIVTFVSYLTYHFVEQPSNLFAKKIIGSMKANN